MQRRRFTSVLGAGIVAVLLCACSTSSTSGSSSTTEAPLPAGPVPSKIATMVCSHEAREKFNKVLGEEGDIKDRMWVDHQYSCNVVYPDGYFTLKVKELSSWQETTDYFDQLKKELGDTGSIANLGQGAFRTSNGSIVVRKDWKILTVDVAPLPAQFGVPLTSSAAVAYTVADLILGCWDGD